MIKRKKNFTLIELMLGIAMISIVYLAMTALSVFLINHVLAYSETSAMHMLVNYALEDMKVRCISAVQLDDRSYFSSVGESKKAFTFFGEKEIYTITPDDDRDNVWYSYELDDKKNLVLKERDPTTGVEKQEILIGARYHPDVEFTYDPDTEPHYLKVRITVGGQRTGVKGEKTKITKFEGLRFWYLSVVR